MSSFRTSAEAEKTLLEELEIRNALSFLERITMGKVLVCLQLATMRQESQFC